MFSKYPATRAMLTIFALTALLISPLAALAGVPNAVLSVLATILIVLALGVSLSNINPKGTDTGLLANLPAVRVTLTVAALVALLVSPVAVSQWIPTDVLSQIATVLVVIALTVALSHIKVRK